MWEKCMHLDNGRRKKWATHDKIKKCTRAIEVVSKTEGTKRVNFYELFKEILIFWSIFPYMDLEVGMV